MYLDIFISQQAVVRCVEAYISIQSISDHHTKILLRNLSVKKQQTLFCGRMKIPFCLIANLIHLNEHFLLTVFPINWDLWAESNLHPSINGVIINTAQFFSTLWCVMYKMIFNHYPNVFTVVVQLILLRIWSATINY